MIIRCWQAFAKPDGESAYLAHFQGEVLPALRALAGFRGATVLRRAQPLGVVLTVLTRWESMAAVRTFAGADEEDAVVAPTVHAWLSSYDRHVTHHEVAFDERD